MWEAALATGHWESHLMPVSFFPGRPGDPGLPRPEGKKEERRLAPGQPHGEGVAVGHKYIWTRTTPWELDTYHP